jgi:DNA-binding CsgD family transcriptional regulator
MTITMIEARTQYFETPAPNEFMKPNTGQVSYKTPLTNNESSQKLLENLWQCNHAMGLEVFYFLLDVETLRISEKKGVYQTLGYFDNEFTLDTYFAAIPAAQKNAFAEHWQDIFKGLHETRYNRQQQIITLHGIKKQNGDCLFVKRMSMPHKVDSAGAVLEYLCLFTVVSDYEGQSFQIRAANQFTRKKTTKQQQENSKSFSLPFTRKELELLRAYADDNDLTATRLAEDWSVSYNTVLTHKNNAMTKARRQLALHFPNVSTLAKRLREMGMV